VSTHDLRQPTGAARRRRAAHGRSFPPLAAALLAAAILAAPLLQAGCGDEQRSCPTVEPPLVRLEEIFATADTIAVGGTVRLWALPTDADQTYAWSTTAGRFLETDSYYARWKAPDTPTVARIIVTASLGEESVARNRTIAVGSYRPRHEPTYTGAGYCGVECHSARGHGQRYDTWVLSAHARAYEKVEAHPDYAPACAACHAVGYGDASSAGWDRHNGGFDEIPVARLEGVQCESCHGPLADLQGEILPAHAEDAGGDWLFALGTASDPLGCARCHGAASLAPHPGAKDYAAEWRAGGHAGIPAGAQIDDPACAACHTAQGFVARLTGAPAPAPSEPQPITCVACHDPHGNARTADLRPTPGGDVCSRCHSDGEHLPLAPPHAPQAQMLAGTGGHEYPGRAFPSTPHRNVAQRGCVECHYPSSEGRVSHSFAPDAASCRRCHPAASGGSFWWIQQQRTISNLLVQLDQVLGAASPADSLTDAFRRAEFNRRFVGRDASRGAHNYAYARALLEASLEDFVPGRAR